MVGSSAKPRTEGHYDVRKGAAGYAPIVGAFGALAVPAIIVLFTVPATRPGTSSLIALAVGLLVVAMVASVAGSIAMAALGAEQDETANLPAAIMLQAVPVVISLVSVLAAFEALAALYLPTARTLFALIAGAGGVLGVFFTALVIGDSWLAGPSDPDVKEEWVKTQWIKCREDADRQTLRVSLVGVLPALVGISLRLAAVDIAPSATVVNWLVGSALALSLGGVVLGMLRTFHPKSGVQKGIRNYEAYGTTLSISCFSLALMVFLP